MFAYTDLYPFLRRKNGSPAHNTIFKILFLFLRAWGLNVVKSSHN